MKLQVMLKSDSENDFDVNPTGVFGPITKHAMMKFHVRMGIAASSTTDGSVGPLTRGFFNRACGKGLIKHGNSNRNASSTNVDDDDDDEDDDSATSSSQRGNSDNKGKGNPHDEDDD